MKSCQMSPHISVTSISLPTNYETISKNTGKCNKPLTNTVQDGSLSIGKTGLTTMIFPQDHKSIEICKEIIPLSDTDTGNIVNHSFVRPEEKEMFFK